MHKYETLNELPEIRSLLCITTRNNLLQDIFRIIPTLPSAGQVNIWYVSIWAFCHLPNLVTVKSLTLFPIGQKWVKFLNCKSNPHGKTSTKTQLLRISHLDSNVWFRPYKSNFLLITIIIAPFLRFRGPGMTLQLFDDFAAFSKAWGLNYLSRLVNSHYKGFIHS